MRKRSPSFFLNRDREEAAPSFFLNRDREEAAPSFFLNRDREEAAPSFFLNRDREEAVPSYALSTLDPSGTLALVPSDFEPPSLFLAPHPDSRIESSWISSTSKPLSPWR